MGTHRFKKFGFEGKRRQGQNGGVVLYRTTQGAERVRQKRKGPGGPWISRSQHPSLQDRHGGGRSVRPRASGVTSSCSLLAFWPLVPAGHFTRIMLSNSVTCG